MCGIHQRRSAMFVRPLLFDGVCACVCMFTYVCCVYPYLVLMCAIFQGNFSSAQSICSCTQFVIVCSVIISRLHYPNYGCGTITTLTNAHPSGLSCLVCLRVCVWRWLHLLTLPILWQLSLITPRMDADLPLTSSGLETADN